MAKILCIADAPGPAEFLAPVIPLLSKDNDVKIVAVGTAMSVLGPLGAIRCDDESAVADVFANIKPDLLVSAISSLTHGPYVNNAFLQISRERNVPVICLQDIWGNHRMPQNNGIMSRINAVCVLDDYAASLWREDGFVKDIFITGNPAFDQFEALDVKKEKMRLRAQLQLDDLDQVILFAGQGTPQHIEADKKTFAFITEAIRGLSATIPVKLIARYHPRAIETGYYEEYAYGIEMIDTSALHVEFSDEILPAADVIIGMFSTNLIHACYVRIPGVSVLLPEWGRATLDNIGLDDFPPNIMRATAGVYGNDPAELTGIFTKIFSDESFRGRMRKAQEDNFPLDAKATERAKNAIMSMPLT